MNTKLNQVQNWPELARQANWSVAKMAEHCSVSENTLRRHFLQHTGKTTRHWLAAQRLKLAFELIQEGSSIKETAFQLGYQYSQNFSREFKKRWGQCPHEIVNSLVDNSFPKSNGGKGYTMNDLDMSISFQPGQNLLR